MTDTIRTKNELKSLFENGDIPSGSDFNDLITTFVSLSADQTILGKSNFNDEVTFNDIIKITNLTPNQVVILNDQNVLSSTNTIDASFQIRRGEKSELDSIVLKEGELAFTTDEKLVYVGDGSNNIKVGQKNIFTEGSFNKPVFLFGENIFGFGDGFTLSGDYSVAIGQENYSKGAGSITLGLFNTAIDVSNVFGSYNYAENFCTVAGGQQNIIKADPDKTVYYAFIGGGRSNEITDSGNQFISTIAGGGYNKINSSGASILGGYFNQISSVQTQNYGVIGGGRQNKINGRLSNIVGGFLNEIHGTYSDINGGRRNIILSDSSYCGIFSGNENTIETSATYCNILGGFSNYIASSSDYSNILGGNLNHTQFDNTFILGSSLTAVKANTTYVNNLSCEDLIETKKLNNLSFETSAISFSSSLIFQSDGNDFLRVKKDNEERSIPLYNTPKFIKPMEFSLRFNNINVYDVAGDTGDKNMGGDLGLQFIIMPISDYEKPLIKSEDNDYYYYDLDLILQEAYGGNVNIYSGIQVTYSNTTGGFNTEAQVMGLSTRYSADGNKGSSHRRFNIQVPKNYLSELVTYVRFDVMCGRQGAGSTGIVGAQLRFN